MSGPITQELQMHGWSATGVLLERMLQEQQRIGLVLAAVEAHLQDTRVDLHVLEAIVIRSNGHPALVEQVSDLAHQYRLLTARLDGFERQRTASDTYRWHIWTALITGCVALLTTLIPYLLTPHKPPPHSHTPAAIGAPKTPADPQW